MPEQGLKHGLKKNDIIQFKNYLVCEKMSKMSRIVEIALDKKHREYVDDADKADEHMQERSLEEDEPYKIPKMIYSTKVESKDLF